MKCWDFVPKWWELSESNTLRHTPRRLQRPAFPLGNKLPKVPPPWVQGAELKTKGRGPWHPMGGNTTSRTYPRWNSSSNAFVEVRKCDAKSCTREKSSRLSESVRPDSMVSSSPRNSSISVSLTRMDFKLFCGIATFCLAPSRAFGFVLIS